MTRSEDMNDIGLEKVQITDTDSVVEKFPVQRNYCLSDRNLFYCPFFLLCL